GGFHFHFDVEEVSETEDVPKLSKKQSWVLVVFAGTFLTMIYGFIPWTDIWANIFNADYPLPLLSDLFGDFYFTEASMLFLVGAVIVGIIGGLGEKGTVNTIIVGAADFLGAALVIVLARGITVVMKNTFITDTILNWMEDLVTGTSSAMFSFVAFVVNIPIAFLVPSSSGHAALVMPIIAPLADFANVGRDIAVTAYQSASGLVNLITPTSAIIMGGLALAGVGYNKYVKFVLPYIGIMFVLVSGFLVLGTIIGG
ncbi:MAG: YfcC family protein, partial [Actinomycetia bacterium]|nr:YfcC family protein [Actinomycetes bacterium]